MNWSDFFLNCMQSLVFIPSAILCYFPVKNQLSSSVAKIIVRILVALLILVPLDSLVLSMFHLEGNASLGVFLLILFIVFYKSVKIEMAKCLSIFSYACALMSFLSNYSTMFDAKLHPVSTTEVFSWEGSLFQFAISCLATILLAYPLLKYGSWLIDHLQDKRIWLIALLVSIMFLATNIAFIPHNYQTLYTNNVFRAYGTVLTVLFGLFFLTLVFFYFAAKGVYNAGKTKARIQFFEMQEAQYQDLTQYIKESARARHDFRQSIFALHSMIKDNKFEEIKTYLDAYVSAMPEKETQYYCDNQAVNALLNYYSQIAVQKNIEIIWNIDITGKKTTLTDTDLCSLLGNLISNAFDGCETVLDKPRYHKLSIIQKNGAWLFIVSTNNFDGVTNMKGREYRSIKRGDTHGIGLSSIRMTAEKYGGTANFHHEKNEFYNDIMLPLK